MAMAGLAAGADGLILEAHPDPDRALCDRDQTIPMHELASIVVLGKALFATLLHGSDQEVISTQRYAEVNQA